MLGYPVPPVYPHAIDTDSTLYRVYNTTEATITAANQGWSQEINIKPQPAGSPEIWPSNGFATISGELLYYDSVALDANGHVMTLLQCVRNLGGSPTTYNPVGTWIRGFVVAEHHNQLVNAILNVENFVGENFSPISATLDWRIRHLFAEPIIFDDFACPDVEFDFNIISNDPTVGVVANYLVVISGGVADNVIVDFGDGTQTTQLGGTHTYPPNANVDPTVTVTSGNCQTVQTPISRTNETPPTVATPIPPFTIQIPIPPSIPSLLIPSINVPSADLIFPPIVFPCLSIAAFPSILIPSLFPLGPFNIPSLITISVPSIAPIQFGPVPNIGPIPFGQPPTIPPIQFGPAPFIPQQINFGPAPHIPQEIFFGPTNIPSRISFGPAPIISVNWGKPPLISCNCVIQCPSQSNALRSVAPPIWPQSNKPVWDDEIEVEYDMVGFPSEIKVLPPKIPPIQVHHDIPEVVRLEHNLHDIKILAPEIPLPSEIRILPPERPLIPDVISFAKPPRLKLDVSTPLAVSVHFPSPLPRLSLDVPESIQVTGIPPVISLEHQLPSAIRMEVPDDLRVPLKYEGPPVEVKINFGIADSEGEEFENPCVMLVPCKPKKKR